MKNKWHIIVPLLSILATVTWGNKKAVVALVLQAQETSRIETSTEVFSDGKSGCPYWGTGNCLVIGCDGSPPVPATWEETVTTTKRIHTLTFTWRGAKHTHEDQEILSREKKRRELRQEWVEVNTK